MTYTHLTLPNTSFRITHATIARGFALVIALSLFTVLGLNYISIEKNNQKLAQKISKFSTSPVSAIANPDGAGAQQSLVPVDKAEVTALLEKLQSLAVVPLDEAPTLATVVELEKLKNEVFFTHAELGDKLFVYQQARLAVLYRPDVAKIVNMANLFDQSGGKTDKKASGPQVKGVAKQASAGAQMQYKLAIYYATDSAQLREKVGKALSAIPNVEVATEALTREVTYKGTTIVDLKGGQDAIVAELVKKFGGKKGNLPPEEDLPDTDILAIVGE